MEFKVGWNTSGIISRSRINRNIMEFKDTKEQVEANLMLRINRNIMEFKDFLIISAFLVAFTN